MNIKKIFFALSLIFLVCTTQVLFAQEVQPPNRLATLSGTFATRPSAQAGLFYFATDLGSAGVLLISDGNVWKPATGSAVIYQSGVQTTLHTGDTNESLVVTVTIPAGLLSANGGLRITCHQAATGTNNTKTLKAYYSATSGIAGTIYYNVALTAPQLSASFIKEIYNRNSTSSQISSSTGNTGASQSSGIGAAMSINNANTSYLNFTVQLANSADASGLDALQVEWIEP